jgi:hypothetical protein
MPSVDSAHFQAQEMASHICAKEKASGHEFDEPFTSCSISLLRLRSATRLRSLLLSSSSCFRRRISVGSRPSYFFFQLK